MNIIKKCENPCRRDRNHGSCSYYHIVEDEQDSTTRHQVITVTNLVRNNASIDVSGLPPGTYLVKLAIGKRSEVKKVIKV